MTRWLAAGLLIALMAGFGLSVYRLFESQKRAEPTVANPTKTSTVTLPGTMYLAQGGALYQFQRGKFVKLTPAAGWMQPALAPDGTRLAAVKRVFNFSDLYLLDTAGHVQEQLTHNGAVRVESNHWAFFPRFSADGKSVFYSYDPKDPGNTFRVDLAIYALPLAGGAAREWTYPNFYTGGDATPLPLKSGALVYTKSSIDPKGAVHTQIWLQLRAGSTGVGLTAPEDDCDQPTVSPDWSQLAMACRHGALTADLEVAAPDLAHLQLGTPAVLVPAGLNAAPAFSPDGHTLAYFAPDGPSGPFQLWAVALPTAAGPSPSPRPAAASEPRQITHALAFDTTAAPAWA